MYRGWHGKVCGWVLSVMMLASIGACRDDVPVAPTVTPVPPRPVESAPIAVSLMPSTALGSITQIDPFTYPRYPERWSAVLDGSNGSEGARGSFTSVIFTQPERVYPDTALVQARVTGIRQRFYAQIPAWNSRPVPIGGQPWMPQDAAGDWINSSGCQGNIQLEGMVGGQPFGGAAFFCVRNRPLDAPRLQTIDTTGVIWGQSRIRRHGGYELNIHQFCGWNGFPQCFDYVGSQSMTVVPVARTLTITAVPSTNFVAGDSITFTATTPHPRTIRQWQWIPADTGQPVQVIAHCGTSVTCRMRVPGDGLLVVRARVVPWGQLNRIETAHARVTAPKPRLIVEVSRRFVGAGDTVLFTLRAEPVRPITQPVWATLSSLRAEGLLNSGLRAAQADEVIGRLAGMAISGCQPGSPFCAWRVLATTRKDVNALVNGVAVSADAQVVIVPCPTGDPILDDPDMRAKLAWLLDTLSNANDPDTSRSTSRKEWGGFFYRDNATGKTIFRLGQTFSNSVCHNDTWPPENPPLNATLIGRVHTHPASIGESVECLENPSNDPERPDYRFGWRTYPGGPSDGDLETMWIPSRRHPVTKAIVPNPMRFLTQYIIDKQQVYRLKYDDPRFAEALAGARSRHSAADQWPWRGAQCSWF